MCISLNKQTMSFQTCRGCASRIFHGKSEAVFSHFKYAPEKSGSAIGLNYASGMSGHVI